MDLDARIAAARRRLATTGRRRERDTVRLSAAVEELRLRLDPELAADRAAWLEREEKDRWARNAHRHVGRHSGWKQTPQCPACKQIKSNPAAICDGCGFAPDGGYLGVPAKRSHLERWR